MSAIQTLPLLEGAKFIIIDEGLEATFAETLITGWLKMWEKKKSHLKIDIISFSNPKYLFVNHFNLLKLNNVSVTDFYTLQSNKTDLLLDKLQNYLQNVGQNYVIVLNCLSTLCILVGRQKTIRFIDELKATVGQLICIYRRDFGKLNLPNIETMGTTYVRLEEHSKTTQSNNYIYKGIFTHRKLGGSILRQTELVTQDINTYELMSTKVLNDSSQKLKNVLQESPKEVIASFRLEMNEQEMTQRRNTPLPYIDNKNKQTTIFYEPEDFDDEEEDLDVDLEI